MVGGMSTKNRPYFKGFSPEFMCVGAGPLGKHFTREITLYEAVFPRIFGKVIKVIFTDPVFTKDKKNNLIF